MKKTLWLDLETTGLDAAKHGIIQIAMLMEIDDKIEGELLIDIQPFSEDILNIKDIEFEYGDIAFIDKIKVDDIIESSGIKMIDIIQKHIKSKEAYQKIIKFLDGYISRFDKLDKAFLGGYNVQFDRGFISAFFKKNGDYYLGSYLNWKLLDPLYLLWQMDADGFISLENYKLETTCNHFGIEISAHNALSDVKATYELYRKLRRENESKEA